MLAQFDAFQHKCTSEFSISDKHALFHFDLASISCKRNTATRGLIHRRVLKTKPEQFGLFLQHRRSKGSVTRSANTNHRGQILDIRNGRLLEIERRSALGFIWVYNRLPHDTESHHCDKNFSTKFAIIA